MVQGDDGRMTLYRLYPNGKPRQELVKVEGDLSFAFPPDSDNEVEFRFFLGCRPEYRDKVLRENPCLVRQEDGSFKVLNPDKQGPAYIVE